MQEEGHLNKRRISDLELRSKVKCEADRNGKLAGIAAEQRSVGPYFQRPEQPANQQQDCMDLGTTCGLPAKDH